MSEKARSCPRWPAAIVGVPALAATVFAPPLLAQTVAEPAGAASGGALLEEVMGTRI
jgi:hypothetical protein